jgi:hypothetical protein
MFKLPEGVTPDTPLRLKDAVRIAFPDGSLSVSGARREISKGRLKCSQIAGKQFTTIRDIQNMVEQCRVSPRALGSGSNPKAGDQEVVSSDERLGQSETAAAKSAQAALRTTAAALSGS